MTKRIILKIIVAFIVPLITISFAKENYDVISYCGGLLCVTIFGIIDINDKFYDKY